MSDRPGPRIPSATYRVQFRPSFPLDAGAAIVPYLDSLGASDLYASPILRARRGSDHGYDVTDYGATSDALGGAEALGRLVEALRARGMGLLLDLVSNHMGIADETNRWWEDVLENGPSSPFARHFDIDWRPPKTDLEDRVLLPVLGDMYGAVLERGEIRLGYEAGSFHVSYWDRRFPIAPRTAVAILEPVLHRAWVALPAEDPRMAELESVITQLKNLPLRSETDEARIRERQREKEVAKRRLAALVDGVPEIRRALEETIAEMNGRVGDPRSFDALDSLLSNQAYRLCHWRVAADEVNYRRFFDVNELAAVRVEDPAVFDAVHAHVLDLVARGWVTGLRIDHVDGLHDPEGYLRRLRAAAARPLYLVVEKILGAGERLRPSWPVEGTTGYDFLNLVNGLFVEAANAGAFRDLYQRFTGVSTSFPEVVSTSKKFIMLVSLTSELAVLARRLDRISEHHRRSRDFTLESLRFALREVIAAFPVYRSYVRAAEGVVRDEDRALIETAVRTAKRRNPATSPSIFDFIASVLLLDDPPGLDDWERAERREFVMRFQQLTSPVAAKGVEDTAFYRWFPLASLNEVGGEPERFGVAVPEFHRRCAERARERPHAMNATSTHDSKRSEDVRARIDVLSEIPVEWEAAIRRWRGANTRLRREVDGREAPDANEEYLLFQTLVGTWPLEEGDDAAHAAYVGRIERYMEKATKEAKVRTSWINPNEAHDEAVRAYVRGALDRAGPNPFLDDLRAFVGRVAPAACWTSLAQVLMKCAAPGVPDVYQGTETWDLSLVDPDNRRPVDFEALRVRLEALDAEAAADADGLCARLADSWRDGRVKTYVLSRALRLRRERPDLFRDGGYLPLDVAGERAAHAVAFARTGADGAAAIAVAGRLFASLVPPGRPPVGAEAWGGTRVVLPSGLAGVWRDAFTGRTVKATATAGGAHLHMSETFARLPVSLLSPLSPAPDNPNKLSTAPPCG